MLAAHNHLISIALCLICLPFAFGQTDRAVLSGTVTDQQGAPIPGATVRAVQLATGLERQTFTSSSGNYRIDRLPVGRYSVLFSKPGLSDVRVHQVEHVVGETRTLDARLSVGGFLQQTTVNEALVQLERSSVALEAAIEQSQLRELPTNGRNWSHLTALVPGATDTGASDQRTIRFAGHGLDDNNFTVDGVDASGVLNQAQKQYVRLAIPLESISQFQVQSQNFRADTGATAGGQIAVASSYGTNEFHGSLFEYFRNGALDARSPFSGSSPAPFLLNQFGGSIGGPILQNKAFFFADYEGLRQRLGQTQIGLVPSPSFAGQVLAQTPAVSSIISAYPHGTSPAANPNIWNYVAEANQVDIENSGTIRIDEHLTRATTAFLRFSADEADYTIPIGPLNALQSTGTKLKNGVVEVLHVFSPALVSEFKAGFNQDQYHVAAQTPVPFAIRVSGLSPLNAAATSDGQGSIYSYINDTTWMHGRHTLKFGTEVRAIRLNQGNSQNGTLTYGSPDALLANSLDSASYSALLPLKRLPKTQFYGYVQDEMKATPKLVLTLGLRYSFFNVFHEKDGRAIPFDLETCGGYCAQGSEFTHPRYNDADPRIGVAWSHGDTVLRLGGGIYHSDGQEDDQNLPYANDVQRYSLNAVKFPGLSFPIAPFLSSATGIVSPRDMYRNRKDFYVSAWTASVERRLPAGVVGTVSYVGNKGTDVLTTTFQNVNDPVTGTRPYPQFGTIEFRKNDSNSTFHALQWSARRAFERGWLLSANYMWSHSINDDGIGGGESDVPQNVSCRACEKASSDFDERHVFNATAVYELPLGAGKDHFNQPGLARAALGGFQVSGVLTARSGLPVNVTVDRASSALPDGNSVAGSERPNLVPSASLLPPTGQTPGNWINPAAFVVPAPNTWGNAGRNLVRGPRLWQVDASLAKIVSLSERVKLQCRVEAYNVFNRAQYGQPLANLSSPLSFGQITTLVNQGATGSGTPREFQFALRLSF